MIDDADLRVRRLFESAGQAFASGRPQDAEQLMRQAESMAPAHPLVQGEIAARMLRSGDAAGARDVLEQAVKADPSRASLWLNLAAALRRLNRVDEEKVALRKAIALEPRNLRALLQAASLHELQGQTREAAATYRNALQMIPPGAEPPPEMRPVLQHAQDVVDANHRALEAFIESRLKDVRSRHAGKPVARFDRCLDTLLKKRRIYRQQPSFMFFPNLPTIEFYDRADFPWLDSIESATDDIRGELLDLLADERMKFEPYVALSDTTPLDQWRELNHSRRWGVFFLWREGAAVPENIARCPRTVAALETWPRCDVPGSAPSALFSILDAKTHIPPHSGISNTRLIVHLPLIIPPGCRFRVGGETREWQPGKAWVFDDTVEHEAWNDSEVPRAVLIFDLWSPFLSEAERDLVRTATAAVGDYYGTRSYRES
jgi:aspartate beta-hydroxylase